MTPLRAAAYVVAQCGGAIAGSSVVLGLYGGAEPGDLQYTATRWGVMVMVFKMLPSTP